MVTRTTFAPFCYFFQSTNVAVTASRGSWPQITSACHPDVPRVALDRLRSTSHWAIRRTPSAQTAARRGLRSRTSAGDSARKIVPGVVPWPLSRSPPPSWSLRPAIWTWRMVLLAVWPNILMSSKTCGRYPWAFRSRESLVRRTRYIGVDTSRALHLSYTKNSFAITILCLVCLMLCFCFSQFVSQENKGA